MNEYIEAALRFAQDAEHAFDRSRRTDGEDNARLSMMAAAIATAQSAERQAVAAEWQAQTAVRQALAMERIAALLGGVITPALKDTDGFIRVGAS